MPVSEINALRKSEIVKRVIHSHVDSTGEESYVLKIRAELINGWLLDFFEHGADKNRRRYSFHVFQSRKMIIRWDNAPHHPEVESFPHHKHVRGKIEASNEMTLALVLSELQKMMEKS